MFKRINTKFAILLVSLMCSNFSIADNNKQMSDVNVLELYQQVTSLTMAFNEKYGHKAELPYNVKTCINNIEINSNLTTYLGTDNYGKYADNSPFVHQAEKMTAALDKLMAKFNELGFIQAIINNGKIPAIMFDIDNTLEMTSFTDDYYSKSTENDPASVDFVREQCFKNGIQCYFITARYCNEASANTTASWVKEHLGLTNEQIANNVFLSGSVNNMACTTNPTERVAYKDAYREALSEQKNMYWLISMGDQMTDWFGANSGLKVWYPNMLFDSSIIPNNSGNKDNCSLQTVVAPSKQCYSNLKDGLLEHSTINYCKNYKDNKYFYGTIPSPIKN